MKKGKRYDNEPKLNIKKVIAVIVAIIVIIMFIVAINKLLDSNDTNELISVKSYYPVYTNEKWGVINSNGEIVIAPTMDEMIIIPDNKTDLFICNYDINYEDNTYKTKVINSKNEEKFNEYDLVEAIENIDKSSNTTWYEEKVLKVKKDNKYGLIDYQGKLILDTIYDKIYALEGIKNSIIIEKENKLGLCDNTGTVIIEPEYKKILPIGNDNKNGYIVVNQENKYGVIDTLKKEVLQLIYDEVESVASNGYYVVKQDGVNKIVDKDKSTHLENKFDEVCEIKDEIVIYKKNNKYGAIKLSGEEVVQTKYDYLTFAFLNSFIAKTDNKYGVINNANEEKLKFEYSNIEYVKDGDFLLAYENDELHANIINSNFENKEKGIISDINIGKGYINVRKQTGENIYYNFKFEQLEKNKILQENSIILQKDNNLYGYVNADGKKVVDYIYNDAKELNQYGYAAVNKDGKWGAIDKNGKVVCECIYDLKYNILIDFIGKWHIGVDTNSIYYTDEK